MIEWNEASLRGAAGWKAFKDGKSLLEAGRVMQAKSTPDGWTGSVQEGKRVLRLGVKVKKPGDFETRCSCPENQATGALCAHAIATGLALLKGADAGGNAAPRAAKDDAAPSVSSSSVPGVVWSIGLPPNWREAISRGRLAVNLKPVSADVDPADASVSAWLKAQGGREGAIALALDGPRLQGFLTAAANHPRVTAGNRPIGIRNGESMSVEAPERKGDSAWLSVEGEPPVLLGSSLWSLREDALVGIGPDTLPDDLLPLAREWSEGRPAKLPARTLLRRIGAWEDWLAVPDDSWLAGLRFVTATPGFELELDGTLQQLEATLTVRYPDLHPVAPGEADDERFPRQRDDGDWEARDFTAEREALDRLRRSGFIADGKTAGRHFLRGENDVLAFFAHHLPDLRRIWSVRESDRFQRASRGVEIVKPDFKILGSGEDWLAFDYGFQTGSGEAISRAEVLQWLRSGRSSKSRPDGRRLVLDQEAAALAEPLLGELEIRQEHGHFVGPKAIGELISEIRKNFDSSLVSNESSEIDDLQTLEILGAEISGMLRPYQKVGIGWLIDRTERFGGALLADDMGLGKTLQTLAVIEHAFQNVADGGPALVVCPTSLLGNWKAEFQRFAPARTVRVLHGGARETEQKKVSDQDVVVTSYGTLARDLAWHLKREYRVVAVDEASLMRNPDTDHAKAISKLNSRRRIALTGTPVENGVRDLWSIFRFVQPGWLGSRDQFQERYEAPIQSGTRPAGLLERLRLKTAPFILRRTKEEVARDLPAKLIIDDYSELSSDQRQVYREILNQGAKLVDETKRSAGAGAARLQMLTALLRLRQVCCDLALLKNERLEQLAIEKRSAKLSRLLEILESAVSGNHRVLVFSQFQSQLREIRKCLQARDWDSLLLDGQTRNRQDLVDRFQKAEGPPVFLISLKAGGYGLNLTAADTVVHFDPWWNPAAEAQATDRAHRIGQTRPVTVYRLLTRGTVEEKVVRLQATKRELANATLDENGISEAGGWSERELQDLLQG